MSFSSFVEDLRAQSHLSNFMLGIFLFLLLLLASVLWVTLCMAICRALKHYAEDKRQRQRRHLMETAIQRAIIHQRQHISSAAAGNMSIFSTTNAQMADSIFGKLPSYDEALKMEQILAEQKQESRSNSRYSISRCSVTNQPQSTQNKLLRLAPHRPSANRITGPQMASSLESSVQIEKCEQEHWEQCRVLGDEEIAERRLQNSSSGESPARNSTRIEVPDITDRT